MVISGRSLRNIRMKMARWVQLATCSISSDAAFVDGNLRPVRKADVFREFMLDAMTSHHLPVSLTSVRSWPQTGIAEHVRARIISDNALRQTGLGWLRKLAFPGINLRHAASSLPNRDFVGTSGEL